MTISSDARIAVVTGASSGIGEATARTLAAQGFHVVIGARRVDRLEKIAEEIGGTALELDVTDEDSVDAFAAVVPVSTCWSTTRVVQRVWQQSWTPIWTTGGGCGRPMLWARCV